ncbi:SMI1/KNR4 family protein [Pasteurella testudinis]|uniref:SMI1/KNR4 family protein n=1 Tax=Pasteurella testudinis TaxID=761 RepID=UPI004059C7D2
MKNWNGNKEISLEKILTLESFLNFKLPEDYLEFMLSCNGGEGFVGDDYFILWEIDDLINYNKEYEVNKYLTNVFLIGSNGGGEAIGFKLENMNVIRVPFIGMDEDYIEVVANEFKGIFNPS